MRREKWGEHSKQNERCEKGSEIGGTWMNQRGNNNNKASELSRSTEGKGQHGCETGRRGRTKAVKKPSWATLRMLASMLNATKRHTTFTAFIWNLRERKFIKVGFNEGIEGWLFAQFWKDFLGPIISMSISLNTLGTEVVAFKYLLKYTRM